MKNLIISCKLFLIAAVILLAAGIYLTTQTIPTLAAVQDGAALYKTKCASCHALDGSGNTAAGKKNNVRDLRSAETRKMSEAQMSDLIVKGKGKMPGGKSYGADQVKQLVTHVRGLK